MAILAGCRHDPHVRRALRAFVIGLVTLVTIGIGSQRAVVKERTGERRCRMAIPTSFCEIHRHVVGRFIVIGLMAGEAVHGRTRIIAGLGPSMALNT